MLEEFPVLAAREAIAWFRRKGFRIGFAWQDVWQDEHARAFTVAKAMSRDLLEEIRAAVDEALSEGLTLKDFRDGLRPKLEARGWWGRRNMVDPLTGETKNVQLGSPRRLKTIFQVNMRTAYQAGRYERIQRTKAALPYMRYVSVMDGRERPEHHAWHGTILPVDHPWWQTHYPPCGWNCRCTVQALNQRTIDRRGWAVTERPKVFPARPYLNKRTGEISDVERGIDPGWSYHVGAAGLDGLSPAPIPPGVGDQAAAADLGDVADLAKAFLGPFGLTIGNAEIFTDRDGWPFAISAGWFRDAAGQPSAPAGATAAHLDRVAAALIDPDAIAWRWVRAEDGSAVLMRRYLRSADGVLTRVDVGRLGWRYSIATGEVASSYNPHQARDRNGRWRSSKGIADFVAQALRDKHAMPPPHEVGHVASHAAARLSSIGIHKADGKAVAVHHELARHIFRRHGQEGRTQKAIRAEDLLHLADIINTGRIVRGSPPASKVGAPRFHVAARVRGHDYEVAFEARRRHIVPVSMRKS